MGYQPNKRDKIIVWLSNQLLRLATKEYRALLSEFIRYGIRANAVKNLENEETEEVEGHTYAEGRHDGMVKARREIWRLGQRQGWDTRLRTAWTAVNEMVNEGNQ